MVFSCNQDPIFFKISQETIPVKPHVPGSPTNMVEFDRNATGALVMYVASGKRLYWYKDGIWDSGAYSTPQPGGWIMGLAVTQNFLYALCSTDSGIELRRIGKNSGGWDSISISDTQYTVLQTIHADPGTNQLFAGARYSDPTVYKYGILSVADDASSLQELIGDTQLLSGAASNATNTYYLSTTGKGVYKIDGTTSPLSVVSFSREDNFFVGMIKLKDTPETIIMVERNGGAFYKVNSDEAKIEYIGVSTGKYAMGGMALWTDGSRELLIAGIQGGLNTSGTSSLFTHGYVEIELNEYHLPTGSIHDPPTITVASSEQYQASLGKHPIKYLHQAPDGRFFASTQSTGLWSYKERSDGLQWNAEN